MIPAGARSPLDYFLVETGIYRRPGPSPDAAAKPNRVIPGDLSTSPLAAYFNIARGLARLPNNADPQKDSSADMRNV